MKGRPTMRRLFCMIMAVMAFAAMRASAAPASAKFDTDGDGKVSKKEWVDARFKQYEAAGKSMTVEKLGSTFDEKIDLNHDGFADEVK